MAARRAHRCRSLLGGGWLIGNDFDSQRFVRDLPTVKINDDDSLLAHWPSEDWRAARRGARVPVSMRPPTTRLCSHYHQPAFGRARAR